jgi:hypothetical protein
VIAIAITTDIENTTGTLSAPRLSVICTVKVTGPAVVGVPEKMPAADRLIPGGGAPLITLYVYGGAPFEADREFVYGYETSPVRSDGFVKI